MCGDSDCGAMSMHHYFGCFLWCRRQCNCICSNLRKRLVAHSDRVRRMILLCNVVIAIDNSPVRLALARHNAVIYGVQDRIEFVLADFPSFVRSLQTTSIARNGSTEGPNGVRSRLSSLVDVVFLSPPWGGPSYLTSPTKSQTSLDSNPSPHPEFTLNMTAPLPGDELFALARTITAHVAYYLPRNTNLEEVSNLVHPNEEKVQVEEEWMGMKLKALTFYFGGLAKGQSNLWTD